MEVIVTVAADGKSTIEINGAVGSSCEDITAMLTDALGGKTISDVKKPEYYDTQSDLVPRKVPIK